jgi:hypothetical protein
LRTEKLCRCFQTKRMKIARSAPHRTLQHPRPGGADLRYTRCMARRYLLGCVLAVCALAACKDKGDETKTGSGPLSVDQRCERLGKLCGDKDKHVQKLIDECKQALTKQPACTEKLSSVYDCYEKELCGSADKVWAIDDLRVLAERKNTCVAERKAIGDCTSK